MTKLHQQADQALLADFDAVSRDDWIAAIEASLAGRSLEDLTTTRDGIDIAPVASVDDLAGRPHPGGLPGNYPYLRGTTKAGYLEHPWQIAGEIAIDDPVAWNQALKSALQMGQNAIFIGAQPRLESAADLKAALKDIDLTRTPLLLAGGERALQMAKLLRQAGLTEARGCIAYDPLHGLAQHGFMREDAFDLMARHIRMLESEAPQLGSIGIRAQIYHDAGVDAAAELAYALATAVDCLRALLDRGCAIDAIAGRTHFFLSVGENFFIEIAKLRAMRQLWARVTEVFGAGEAAQKLKLHARCGRRNKTLLDPHVNLLRATNEALAAVIGGVDSLLIPPFNETSGDANDFSRRLALNIQHILAHELGLTQLIDPAGGSWHIERLSDALAQNAWQTFQSIEARGGMLAALRTGQIQRQVEAMASRRLRDMATRETLLIGSNAFPDLDEDIRTNEVKAPVRDDSDDREGIRIQPLQPIRLASAWETLRLNAENYRRDQGHRPRVRVRARDESQLAQARACLAAGGFDCVADEPINRDATLVALDDDWNALALNQQLQARMGIGA